MVRETLSTIPISRRRVLAGSALAGVAAFIAACGTKGTASEAPASGAAATPVASAGVAGPATPSPELNWANWSYYIDIDENDPTKHPTIEGFTAEYGTVVHYEEVIEGNDEFVATIKDALNTGKDTGWDIITLTDWMAAKLIRLGWIEAFNPENVANLIANIKDVYKAVDWDPDVQHHAPWRSGMTGVGFDSDKVGDITSLAPLFTSDPKWNGKVEYLSEMRDAIGLSMLYLGLDPAVPTNEDADKAVALMEQAKADGIIRDVKGQSYTEDLKSGDAVLSMAWSGDMVQAQIDKASLAFALASEGGMLWSDHMMIPKGAAHKGTAELLVNYYYDPEVSAAVSGAVDYISPVKGSDELLPSEKKDSPLINPPAEWVDRLHIFGALTEEQEIYFNEQFAKVLGVG